MYNPEEGFELQRIAETLHKMIDEFEEKHDDNMDSFHAMVDSFDQLANDYMNSCDEQEKAAIRKQAFSQLKDIDRLFNA